MRKAACLLIMLLLLEPVAASGRPDMAVASNMTHPITEIADTFRRKTGIRPRLVFGSSGNFSRQIIQGAPFKIFLSADRQYVDILRQNDRKLLAEVKYARGHIGVYATKSSSLAGSPDLGSVIKKLFHSGYRRLVIANPEHAPYGRAARQALQRAGLWVIDRQRLLLAENAAQATQIAASGNVDVGIIPASHAGLPAVRNRGTFFLIPETWHRPLQQYLVLLDGADDTEAMLFEFLQEDHAREVIERYGYSLAPRTGKTRNHGLAGP